MKCRCLTYLNYKTTGEYSMDWRMTLTVLTLQNFHREFYMITDLDLWFETNMEYGSQLIKKHIGENSKYRFRKKFVKYIE